MEEKILIVNHLHKSFGTTHALNDVSLEVAPSEIYCLVGENGSGKSTFVKTVSGNYAPDSGEIILNGNRYDRCTIKDAINEGVQVIYQDFSLFEHMSVAENIAINKILVDGKRLINWKEIKKIAKEQLEKVNISIELDEIVENISIANKQLVAICRALSLDAKIIFMDEPTSALTKSEVNRLISIVLGLKKKGISIIFISHKLDEVMEIADHVAIFRDGAKVGDFPAREVDEKTLTYHMTGREVEYPRYTRIHKDDRPVLEVDGLTRKGNYENISFKIRRGDIFGIIGLLGSGRTELALSLFGLNPPDGGRILVNGEELSVQSPAVAIDNGISLVPETRQTQGVYLGMSILDNINSIVLDSVTSKNGVLNNEAMKKKAEDKVSELRIVTESIYTNVMNLSGGNAQKVVLGRWIETMPEILILDSPTVGVDVGSKSEIYERIHAFAEKGMGILLISDEIPEILANCNELLIMKFGKAVAHLSDSELKSGDSYQKVFNIIDSDVC
ncbi:MAG: sugar ABC transporter ATP-binding protein [Clostridiales Family XIII bacterium]|jgi:simple sugar transport system ATP-binding protein|nr:sugar ABC transporter ATP-binding protein [Clostridiales Family XIII bacterium]